MTFTDPIRAAGSELLDCLCSAIREFRNCEERAGLDFLIDSLNTTENLLALCRCLGKPGIQPDDMIPALQETYRYLQNQDITGLTDFLEYQVCPSLQSWLGGESS